MVIDYKGSLPKFRKIGWTFGGPVTLNGVERDVRFDLPAIPFVRENRVYVYAEVPLSGQKRTVIIGDGWDDKLPKKWDRNYSSSAFEVVREDGLPVMQLIYERPNKIRVNGIFLVNKHDLFATFDSTPPRYFSTHVILNYSDGRVLTTDVEMARLYTNFNVPMPTNVLFQDQFENQKPLFKYPSWKYPGEFSE